LNKNIIKPNELRKVILSMIYSAQSGHIGGSFSIAEIISSLYNNFDLDSGNKDKLILSKGHAAPAIYAALYLRNIIDEEQLKSFRQVNSVLQGHPDKVRLSNVVATTGSLGQGLSISIGHAIGHKLKNNENKVFCILGDGEMQEGQIWESLMLAPKFNLNNLFVIIDRNNAQNDGYVRNILDLDAGSNLREKIKSFNWCVKEVDGNDYKSFTKSISPHSSKPTCIIANTIKGKGVKIMEHPSWHAKAPNKEEYELAMKELI
jgi:transketolase